MPVIPVYEGRRVGISTAPTSPRISPQVAAAPGEAVAQFGRVISGFAEAQFGHEQEIQKQKRVEAVNRAQEDMTRWVGETKARYAQDPDYETWGERYDAEAKAFGEALLKNAGPDRNTRETIRHMWELKNYTTGFELGGQALGRRIDRGKARTLGAVEEIERAAAETLNPVERRDLETSMELALRSGIDAGFIDEVEGERRRQNFRDAVEKGNRQAAMDAATTWAMGVGIASAVDGLESGRTGNAELDAVLEGLPIRDRRQALNVALSFHTRRRTAENAARVQGDRQQRLAAEQIQRDLAWEEDPAKRLEMLEGLRNVGGMPPATYRRLVEAELEGGDVATDQGVYMRLYEAASHGQTRVGQQVGPFVTEDDLFEAVNRAFADGDLSRADRDRLLRMEATNHNRGVAEGRRYLRSEIKDDPFLYMLNPGQKPEGAADAVEEYNRRMRADPKADPYAVAREIAKAYKPSLVGSSGQLKPSDQEAREALSGLTGRGMIGASYEETMDRISRAAADGTLDTDELLDLEAWAEVLKRGDAWDQGGLAAGAVPPQAPGLWERVFGGGGPAPGESFEGRIPPP